ncbi:MAG TPA: ankyrin repeat domain-containing protein [Pyrinomonadaceae bacterium]|nr:ankyrin repeat domain-containing protein [Pyrinomonadaceae bacterium]
MSNSISELLAASSSGDMGTVQALVESGADVNATDLFGNTPLIYAAAGGHLHLVRWLVMNSVRVNAKNQIGMTALQRAETQGHTEVVMLLKKYGAEDEAQGVAYGAGAAAGTLDLLQAASDGNLEGVRACLATGADVNAKNAEGWTALMIATLKGYREMVQTLLKQDRVQVNARSHHGWTALCYAVSMGDSETIRILLAAGAEVNAPDHDGWTALMQAAGEGNLECVEILLAGGAEAGAKNKIGETASTIAAHKGFTKIVELMEMSERKSKDSVIVEAGRDA